MSILVSLFIGGALTATSIGITIRVLTDLHQRNTREGQIVLGAAVLDDVLGVVLLALLYEFSIAGGITLANTSKVLAFIGLFFILAPIADNLISLLIKHFDDISDIPGLIPTAMVSLVLLFAWLAHSGTAGRLCRRPGIVAPVFPAFRHGTENRTGIFRADRKPDAPHHSTV